MKKFLITILLSLLIAGTAEAYTIRPGDTLSRLAKNFGVDVSDLAISNGIQNPDRIFVGQQLSIPEVFGASNQLPTDGYDSYLSVPLNSSDTSIYVNDLPSGVTSSIYTIYSSDGRTVSEKVSCTGKTSSPNTLTGCTRGLSLTPTSAGTVTETAGTGTDHSKNARIAITDNINFSGKALAILNGDQQTGTSTFNVGETSTNTIQLFLDSNGKYLRAYNNGTNPYIGFNTSTSRWQFTNDGVTTIDLTTSSAGGLTASTTAGIGITNSYIHTKVSTTKALYYDDAGIIAPKTSSTGGIQFGSDGAALDTSDAMVWTGLQTFGNTTSSQATSTALHANVLSVTATSTLATTTVNGVDIGYQLSFGVDKKLFVTSSVITPTFTDNVDKSIFSVTVPANTLQTNNAIRIKVYISDFDGNGVDNTDATFKLKYGTTTSTVVTTISSALTNKFSVYEATIYGNNATNSQAILQTYLTLTSGGPNPAGTYSTSAIDSTANQTLELAIMGNSASGNVMVMSISGIQVDVIQ